MLQDVCEHIHNYFIKDVHDGLYEVADGVISPLDFLKEGQRFLIEGSDLNDGVYTYHAEGLKNDDDTEAVGLHDETFTGTICALAVPPAVLALSGEIKEWVDKYGESSTSPYASENVIGVYSYTKAQIGGGASGVLGYATWQSAFADRMKRWRKVAF